MAVIIILEERKKNQIPRLADVGAGEWVGGLTCQWCMEWIVRRAGWAERMGEEMRDGMRWGEMNWFGEEGCVQGALHFLGVDRRWRCVCMYGCVGRSVGTYNGRVGGCGR